MKARRSMSTTHRHSFKYLSPVVSGKIYAKRGQEDQENIPPTTPSMEESSLKRRKLYNGGVASLCQTMDMDISAPAIVTTPKATHNGYDSSKFIFTPPPNRNPISNGLATG